ncbi:VCBS repeat-containing protein, partial [Candidatus Parcubacteria bacterium]
GLIAYNSVTKAWKQLHGLSSRGLAFGDVDGNGMADLVVSFGSGAGVWSYRNGSVWKQLHATSAISLAMVNHGGMSSVAGTGPIAPEKIAASLLMDVDMDGDNDLIVAPMQGIASTGMVLLNDGSGYFTPLANALPPHYLGKNGVTVNFAKINANNDGIPDIIATTVDGSSQNFYGAAKIELYLGNGDGTFRDASSQIASNMISGWSEWLLVADFDGDGFQDFMTTEAVNFGTCNINMFNSPPVSYSGCHGGRIYLGDGAGNFAPGRITTTDVATNIQDTAIIPLFYDSNLGGAGSVNPAAKIWPWNILVGDINNDGKIDMVAPTFGTRQVPSFINTSTPGNLSFSVIYSNTGSSTSAGVLMDVDGDGFLDLVDALAINNSGSGPTTLNVHINNGKGVFTTDNTRILPAQPSFQHARQWLVADFNLDNRSDLFVADHGIDAPPFPGAPNLLMMNNGKGALVNQTAALGFDNTYTHGASVGDVNGDGFPDIFMNNDLQIGKFNTQAAVPGKRLWLNDGKGGFQPSRQNL